MTKAPFNPPKRKAKPESIVERQVTMPASSISPQVEARTVQSPSTGPTIPPSTPATHHGMFSEMYIFHPLDTCTHDEVLEILRAMALLVGPELFKKLPEPMHRHFLVQDRTGAIYRYTKNKS